MSENVKYEFGLNAIISIRVTISTNGDGHYNKYREHFMVGWLEAKIAYG